MCVGLQVPEDSQVLEHSLEEHSSRSWNQCYVAPVPSAPSDVPQRESQFFRPRGVLSSNGGHGWALLPIEMAVQAIGKHVRMK